MVIWFTNNRYCGEGGVGQNITVNHTGEWGGVSQSITFDHMGEVGGPKRDEKVLHNT